jgi:hypothetical protein
MSQPLTLQDLENPSPEAAASNIDFYHIGQAIKTISEWFEKRDSEVEAIKDGILNKTKIIWFQLSPEENAVAAFTRLNVGKIPLTNGELIRALSSSVARAGHRGRCSSGLPTNRMPWRKASRAGISGVFSATIRDGVAVESTSFSTLWLSMMG